MMLFAASAVFNKAGIDGETYFSERSFGMIKPLPESQYLYPCSIDFIVIAVSTIRERYSALPPTATLVRKQ